MICCLRLPDSNLSDLLFFGVSQAQWQSETPLPSFPGRAGSVMVASAWVLGGTPTGRAGYTTA